MKLNKLNSKTEIWEYFSQNYDYKNEPVRCEFLSNNIQQILSKKINDDKAREFLEVLKYIEKKDEFDYELISQYFKKRNSDLSHAAINSLHNSNSKKAEKILIEFIKNPKSDYKGETAVKVLHMIIRHVENFDELIKSLNSLKKQTKNAAEHLIYVKSFDSTFNNSTEIKNYIQKKKIKSTEKWTFKNWHKSSRDDIRAKILNKISTYSKKQKINSATFTFYVPISKFIYTTFRVVIYYPFNGEIMIEMGIGSFWSSYYGWLENNSTNGYFQLHNIEFTELKDDNSNFSNAIKKWMFLSEKYEQYLMNYDKVSTKLNNPEYLLNIDETVDKGIFTDLELINYALFKDDINKAKEIANDLLQSEFENLGEYWRIYCKNIDKVTVANKTYNLHAE